MPPAEADPSSQAFIRPRRSIILPARYRSSPSSSVPLTGASAVSPQSQATACRRYPIIDPQDDIIRQQRQLIHEKSDSIRAKDTTLRDLKARIQRLERNERQLRRQLTESNDMFANKDAELGEVRRELKDTEERLEGKDQVVQDLIREVHHYQGWWLNENRCLRVALNLARNQKDEGVKAMRESSNARFMTWSGSHCA